ncbi:MAG: DUF1934 domain-containing protein [Clostridia bacterium]|nr:DUF1934 domain-containing protein [Clostridia bacterium]
MNRRTKRTVKLTVRSSDGYGAEPPAAASDDPFDSFTYPIEDVEDAVLRRIDEEEFAGESGEYEMTTTATFLAEDGEASFTYDEAFAAGDEKTKTRISFSAGDPGVVAVMRSGAVRSVLVFEEGKRHTSVYETGIVPFEVTTYARRVENAISPVTGRGSLYLDFIVTVKGMEPKRTVLTVFTE